MKTAEEMPELERLIADMDSVGCTVTVSKTLIWIGGNTYPVKDILKKNGWRWSAKKRMWWMSLDRYCGWQDSAPEDGQDYAITGTASDGSRVVVAECYHDLLGNGGSKMTDYEKNVRMELWERLNDGEISEEEWGLWMWANGFMPDDYCSDDEEA